MGEGCEKLIAPEQGDPHADMGRRAGLGSAVAGAAVVVAA